MIILLSMQFRLVFRVFLLLIFPFLVHGQERIWVDIEPKNLDVTQQVETSYTDWQNRNEIPTNWNVNTERDLHFPYRTGTPWIRLHLWNKNSAREFRRRIYLNSTLVGKVTLWEEGRASPIEESGPGIPVSQRSIKDRRAAFDIILKPLEKKTILLRVESTYLVSSKIFVSSPEKAYVSDATFLKIVYFYIGGVAFLVLYNLIIGFLSRQKEFIVYSFFALAFSWTVLALLGILDTDLLANDVIVFNNNINIFTALTLLAAAYFVPRFLNLNLQFQSAKWFARVLIATSLLCVLTDVLLYRWRIFIFFGILVDLLLVVALIFYCYFGFYIWRKNKDRFAILFILSWAVVFVSVLIWFAPLYGIFEDNAFAQYSLLFGNLAELVLLSMGLAQKFRLLENEKKNALEVAEANDHYQRLVRVLSHDIANVVTSCHYHFDKIVATTNLDKSDSSVVKIQSNGDRLKQILSSVRQEILYRSSKQSLKLDSVNVRKACQQALQNCAWELEEKSIRVDFDIEEAIHVWADKDLLVNQVLHNVIGNSIKFSQPDTILFLSAEVESEWTIVHIQDQGPGLTADQADRIFNDEIPFSTKNSENDEGSGLGTTLVSAYMKLFDGKIKITNSHGTDVRQAGLSVSLCFPRGPKVHS